MDDLRLEAWASGDEEAAGEVRRAVRRLAGRVLLSEPVRGILHPSTRAGLQEAEGRAFHTVEIADEVMRRTVQSAALLDARTLLVTGCRLVELHGKDEQGEHVPSADLVGLALASTGLSAAVLTATSAHVNVCGHCGALVGVLREVAGRLGIRVPDLPAPPSKPAEPEEALPVHKEAERENVQKEPDPIAALRVLGGGGEPPPQTRWDRLLARYNRPEVRRYGPWTVLGFVLLAITGLWLARVDPISITRGGEMVALADRSPPEVARLRALPPEAQLALADLAKGQCADAAERFGGSSRAAPAGRDGSLQVLEAASWICAGDGARALDLLQALPDEQRARHRQVSWLEAQAHLLKGEAQAALRSLDQAIIGDVQNREQAQEQRATLRTALGLDPNIRPGQPKE